MSTTLLFVELVIAGIQVIVWLALLILTVFGTTWLASLPASIIKDWQITFALPVLSFVYVLGILFDRLADYIFARWDRAIARKIFPNAPYAFAVIRFQLSKENEFLNRQFEYTRSRLRIARASALNFLITTLLALTFVLTRLQDSPAFSKLVVFILVAGLLLTLLAVYAWYKLVGNYFGLIAANYFALMKQQEQKNIPDH